MGWKVQNHQLVHFARVCNCPVITFLVQYPEANKHSKGIPPRSIGHNYIYKRWMFHCYVRSREGCWWIMPPAAATLILPPVVPFFLQMVSKPKTQLQWKHIEPSVGVHTVDRCILRYTSIGIYIYMVICKCILIVDAAIYVIYTIYSTKYNVHTSVYAYLKHMKYDI